jgi:hypothetical protein
MAEQFLVYRRKNYDNGNCAGTVKKPFFAGVSGIGCFSPCACVYQLLLLTIHPTEPIGKNLKTEL